MRVQIWAAKYWNDGVYRLSLYYFYFFASFVHEFSVLFHRKVPAPSRGRLRFAQFFLSNAWYIFLLDRAQLFPRGSQSQSIVDSIMSKIDAMARRWKADVEQQRNTVFNRKTALQ